MSKLARIAWNGERISCGAFTDTKKYQFKDQQEREFVAKLPLVKYETIKGIDDGEKYEWYEIGSGKYDRDMYCPRTQTKRTQTMGEFYRNGTVD
jgi:hypothetical protein|nr:MAG TPA: hypothetical protein [Caudoviricetes sp.]